MIFNHLNIDTIEVLEAAAPNGTSCPSDWVGGMLVLTHTIFTQS